MSSRVKSLQPSADRSRQTTVLTSPEKRVEKKRERRRKKMIKTIETTYAHKEERMKHVFEGCCTSVQDVSSSDIAGRKMRNKDQMQDMLSTDMHRSRNLALSTDSVRCAAFSRCFSTRSGKYIPKPQSFIGGC